MKNCIIFLSALMLTVQVSALDLESASKASISAALIKATGPIGSSTIAVIALVKGAQKMGTADAEKVQNSLNQYFATGEMPEDLEKSYSILSQEGLIDTSVMSKADFASALQNKLIAQK